MRDPGHEGVLHISRRHLIQAGTAAGAVSALSFPFPWSRATTALARQETPQTGGTIVAAAAGDPQFDPYYRIIPAWWSYGTLYNALYDYSGEDPTRAAPQLAESDEETDTTLTIKLREGVMFHNGREFVAQDVIDNIERAKDEEIGHYLAAYFVPTVESTEAIDDYTVKITYTKPYALKRDDLATLFILPKEAMADIATNPVGTGPFKFASFAPGDRLELERFDDYYDEGLPYLDGVTVRVLPDAQARVANLLSGDVQLIEGLAESDVSRLTEESGVQVAHTVEGGTWHTVVLNTRRPPLDNKLVRQALNFSLDREKINQLAFFGLSPVTQSRYGPDNFWYYEPAAAMYTFDLDQAKALIEEAGFSDGFTTTISVSEAGRPGSKALAQVWSQDLATIGVTLEIVEKEQNAFYDDYFADDYDIQAYLLGDGLFDPATGINDSSPLRVEDNRAGIETQPFYDEYKSLVEEGVSTIGNEARKPIYDRIQEIWAEESWAPIIAFSLIYVGLSDDVEGFTLPPGGGYRLFGTSIAET
ncbi:MAG: bacterial extracellular solute-binding s, 5 Middle family protein [Thermomicrobiales bacterium]|nr:bacterial extracellular solute-binding s, 5 Middle family protein [Thermomicrobiales bacterium]